VLLTWKFSRVLSGPHICGHAMAHPLRCRQNVRAGVLTSTPTQFPRRAPLSLTVALTLGTSGIQAATFQVTTNTDSSAGSLHDAVTHANNTAEDDTITLSTDRRGAGYPRQQDATVDTGAFEWISSSADPQTAGAGCWPSMP